METEKMPLEMCNKTKIYTMQCTIKQQCSSQTSEKCFLLMFMLAYYAMILL